MTSSEGKPAFRLLWVGERGDRYDRIFALTSALSVFDVPAVAALDARAVEACLLARVTDAVLIDVGTPEREAVAVEVVTRLRGSPCGVCVWLEDGPPGSTSGAAALWRERGADLILTGDADLLAGSALALLAHHARARFALEALQLSLPCGSLVLDPSGSTLFESRSAAALGLGASSTSVALPSGGVDPDLSPAAALREATSDSRARTVELLGELGEERQIERRTQAIPGPCGPGVAIHHSDLAERASLEKKLLEAERSSTVAGLARSVVHDLNNALCVIQSYAHLALVETPVEDARHADLEEVVTAASHAAAVAHRLIAFARRAAGRPVRSSVRELLRRVEPLVRQALAERVELALLASEQEHAALVDPARFEHALLETVALVADRVRGGLITIEVVAAPQEVVVSVEFAAADGGAGNALEVEQQQLVSDLMTRAGGSASFHVSGDGRRAELRMPAAGGDLSVDPVPRARAEKPERILIVEDDARLRIAMTRILTALGYHTIATRSAADARSRAAHEPSDLVVSDVVLPDANGATLLDELRRCERPIARGLLVTGYAASELAQPPSEVMLLLKPFTPDQLGRAVRQVLDS